METLFIVGIGASAVVMLVWHLKSSSKGGGCSGCSGCQYAGNDKECILKK